MRWLILTIAISLTALAQEAFAQERPILRAGTESRSAGEVRPAAKLARTVVATLDQNDIRILNKCTVDQRFKHGDYAALLRAVRIPAGQGRNFWFVRAAAEPYCGALYGAHAFRYFLVEARSTGGTSSYREVFQHSGDEFAIYAKRSHGLNDIEATGCIATGCRSARMSYDGRRYRSIRCWVVVFDTNGRTVSHPRHCGSDDWLDDQASGLWPDR
jgi:hypothetical protein